MNMTLKNIVIKKLTHLILSLINNVSFHCTRNSNNPKIPKKIKTKG